MCETLPECLAPRGIPGSSVCWSATWPTSCWPTRGRVIRWLDSAPRQRRCSGSPIATPGRWRRARRDSGRCGEPVRRSAAALRPPVWPARVGCCHRGGHLGRARWNVAGAHRISDGRAAGKRRPRRRPTAAAVAVRPRPGTARRRGIDPRHSRIDRREHLRRAGRAAAVGRGGRRARRSRVPRGQHARRDDRSPLTALCPIRLGRSEVG